MANKYDSSSYEQSNRMDSYKMLDPYHTSLEELQTRMVEYIGSLEHGEADNEYEPIVVRRIFEDFLTYLQNVDKQDRWHDCH